MRSRDDNIRAHDESVSLGEGRVLFPVGPALTLGLARQIQMTIEDAERAAYAQGFEDARKVFRDAIGLHSN